MGADRSAQRLKPVIFGLEAWITGQQTLDFAHPRGVKLAVKRRVQHQGPIFKAATGHGAFLSFSIISARARARRDITVPTGAPVASAISR